MSTGGRETNRLDNLFNILLVSSPGLNSRFFSRYNLNLKAANCFPLEISSWSSLSPWKLDLAESTWQGSWQERDNSVRLYNCSLLTGGQTKNEVFLYRERSWHAIEHTSRKVELWKGFLRQWWRLKLLVTVLPVTWFHGFNQGLRLKERRSFSGHLMGGKESCLSEHFRPVST